MGVRGLTTYVERNKEKYLKKHKLQDTHIIIDGYSLCAQLYKYYSKSNDVFGGDYDKFAKCIETFFSLLKQCNVIAIVILDGGYETRKLKTVYSRLRNKLKVIRNFNPICTDSATVFPLFLREAFKDTLQKLNITTVRCEYEADMDIACVARELKCPVLSYDSDFYIFDVQYIPFPTLDFHVTKLSDGKGSKYCICCKIYDINRFLRSCGLNKSHLPLMATLLGNDYIKKGNFKKFYKHIKLPKKNGCRTGQYRTIIALIEWLKDETFDSAVRKVLGRLKRKDRYRVAKKIERVTEGYVCTNSDLFEYLGLVPEAEKSQENIVHIDTEAIQSEPESADEDEEESNSESEVDPKSGSEADPKSESDDCESEKDEVASIRSDETIDHIYSEWFKSNLRTGDFPTLFIDLLTLRMCVYTPQMEDTSNLYTLEISLPVLRAICKILLQDQTANFTYLARNNRHRLKKYLLQISELDLPKLNEIEHLSADKSREVFYSVLELTSEDVNKIQKFPDKWQLYLISLVYWVRKSVMPKVTYGHICAIVLCLINLNVIDKKLPNIRSKTYFTKKYDKQLQTILQQRTQTNKNDEPSDDCLTDLIQKVDTNDYLFFIDSFVSNFSMNEKLKTNKRLFALYVVDAFAQFQSCLFFIKYLNILLNSPIVKFDICEFYNGTFIYNLYTNFEKRTDINSYLELLLRNSPEVLLIFKETMNLLNCLINVEHVTNGNKRRRRRKKKEKNTVEGKSSDNLSDRDENNDSFNDVNNKFSVLCLDN